LGILLISHFKKFLDFRTNSVAEIMLGVPPRGAT